jgi:K+-transporting ATPase ATPase A chain
LTVPGVLTILLFFAVILLITKPFGGYLYRVYTGAPTFLDRLVRPAEAAVYRLTGVDPEQEMSWSTFLLALLVFNLAGLLLLYAVLRLQGFLPLNPRHYPGLSPDLAWNTAVSFATNTNWQAYSGEASLSYLSQLALVVQQFLSPLSGIAMLLAFLRGLTRRNASTLGNFWVDITRTLLWVALPIAGVAALVLVALGSPENFLPYVHVTTLAGSHQTIAQGPVAAMTSIMQLGDNGGGFFNANAAHPYAAPNAASLLFQLVLGFSVPAALTYTFGKWVGDTRQGWAVFAAMAILFLAGTFAAYHFELAGTPALHQLGINDQLGNLEGKEVRFGPALSTLFDTSTTAVSWGSTAAANDSFTPLGSLVLLFNLLTGEVIFGSWGVGLLGMLMYAILAVFIAGLMVGRTPEYLGKKIGAYEVKMAVLTIVVPTFVILGLTALALSTRAGLAGLGNPGAHGLSEALYAYASGVGNNGSAFGGLNAATPFYTWTVGLAMLIGRYPMYIPALAMAASLARKQAVPASAGTFPTHGWLFVVLLLGMVVVVSALDVFPVLSLGPLAEQFARTAGGAP